MSGVEVGSGASVCGRGWVHGRGQVQIGEGAWLSPGVVIFSHLDAVVRIGDRCDVGPDVWFITGSHEIGVASRRAGRGIAQSIRVGDGSWIGAGVKILGGVTIGDGTVVAAGAVVTKDVAANTLVSGIPAVYKKMLF